MTVGSDNLVVTASALRARPALVRHLTYFIGAVILVVLVVILFPSEPEKTSMQKLEFETFFSAIRLAHHFTCNSTSYLYPRKFLYFWKSSPHPFNHFGMGKAFFNLDGWHHAFWDVLVNKERVVPQRILSLPADNLFAALVSRMLAVRLRRNRACPQ